MLFISLLVNPRDFHFSIFEEDKRCILFVFYRSCANKFVLFWRGNLYFYWEFLVQLDEKYAIYLTPYRIPFAISMILVITIFAN